jgi:hypothetical protein
MSLQLMFTVLPATRWIFGRLIFDPEDGGDTFLRNIGSHTHYTALYPRRWQCSGIKLFCYFARYEENKGVLTVICFAASYSHVGGCQRSEGSLLRFSGYKINIVSELRKPPSEFHPRILTRSCRRFHNEFQNLCSSHDVFRLME